MLKIKPSTDPGHGKSGSLPPSLTEEMITQRLGVDPLTNEFEEKVTITWRFSADNQNCAIWDYKGVRWSTFGPDAVFAELFHDYRPLR